MEGGGGARRSKTLKESGSERVKDEGEVITVAVWKGCESEIIEQISGITDFYYPFCQQKLMEITGYINILAFLNILDVRNVSSKRSNYYFLFQIHVAARIWSFIYLFSEDGTCKWVFTMSSFISHGWIDKEKSTTMRNFISKKKILETSPEDTVWFILMAPSSAMSVEVKAAIISR